MEFLKDLSRKYRALSERQKTNRVFIGVVAVALLAGLSVNSSFINNRSLVSGVEPAFAAKPTPPPPTLPPPPPPPTIDPDEVANNVNLNSSLGFTASLGNVEPIMAKGAFGIQGGAPDGAISVEVVGSVTKTFFNCWNGATQYSCLSENPSIASFNNLNGLYKNTSGTFQTVLAGPIPGDPYEGTYASLDSTWRDPVTGNIHGWYHSEVPVAGCGQGFYASIGHAVSTDGGHTFTKLGRAITSAFPVVPGACYGQGAGEPKVLESGNYLYMMYDTSTNDYNFPTRGGTSVARALKSDPTTWYKYYNGGFTEPGIGGQTTTVIPLGSDGMQTWSGFVIWNSFLSKFIMLHTDYNHEGQVFIRTSSDLITWTAPQLLFSAANKGYRYATLVGTTDDTMGQSGYIYFGRNAVGDIGPGTLLARRSISFQLPDLTAPVTAITAPANNATVKKNKSTTISASATDNIGVTKVEFYVNNVLTCTDSSSTYSCSWSVPNTAGATFNLQTKAYDAAGNIGVSTVITVKT